MSLNVLIAHEYFIMRYGLEALISDVLGNNTQIDFVDDGVNILNSINSKLYDILIFEVQQRDLNVFSLIKDSLELMPDLKILLVGKDLVKVFISEYISAGAFGFVCLNDSPIEFKNAVKQIFLGRRYFQEKGEALTRYKNKDKAAKTPFSLLSHREYEVMFLLVEGKNVNEISKILDLKASSVSTYRGRIFDKLSIKSLVELISLTRHFNIRG